MRRKIFVANWKMNKTIQETREFLETFTSILPKTAVDIMIAPPFTALASAVQYVREKKISILIGAQNVSNHSQGAFTGEVSATMLKEAGAVFCIIGHSERRLYYREDDTLIHAKIRAALDQGLKPLLCVGESLHEREQGQVEEVLCTQLATDLQGMTSADMANSYIAYEPLWAIGTGNTATPDLAQEAHAIIRDFITHQWGMETAQRVPILYGGSVKPENAASLLREPDIDGALVGGAALDPQLFVQLITSVQA